jgi:hypothetical protein
MMPILAPLESRIGCDSPAAAADALAAAAEARAADAPATRERLASPIEPSEAATVLVAPATETVALPAPIDMAAMVPLLVAAFW